MGKLIDSSILIAAERGQLDLGRALTDHRDETFCISAVTASELLHGVERLAAKKRAVTQAFVEGLLRSVPILPFDLAVARVHARVWAELRAKGSARGRARPDDRGYRDGARAHGGDPRRAELSTRARPRCRALVRR